MVPLPYNLNTVYYLPCRSTTSKITSTVRLNASVPLPPPTAFVSHKYYINKVYKLVVLCTKKKLPVLEYIDRYYMVIFYRQNSVLTCLWNITPLLALYCHPNSPITSTVLLYTIDKLIALIRLRSTDRPIDELYVRPLSLPPLVPYYRPNRQRLCHCAYSRPNNRADTPAIPIMVVPISLQPKHD